MTLITEIHESLPYIDNEPTASERAAAEALIAAEVTQDASTHMHASLDVPVESRLSPLMEQEFARIEAKKPLQAIDLSRYEALEPPATSPHSDEKHPETLAIWREALSKAYTSHTYLTGRQTNLALLEQFGKNSWLVGNSQLEDVLKGLERELAEKKQAIDVVVVERKNRQENAGGEIKLLEENWKRGVGKVLETEVAAENLRKEILDRRRAAAQS
ncbi:hypothetical protein BP6252_12468 [Coleophoma cylindrospora]|uniref:BCAS2 family protein n=1 Tax=Coleophoma cylindrospora TaxID=1849047 RepID=A0A3D8QH05_9HELO|nr:hypothetical protein BP6252_12468 [Coleophoma cylindrospora]